MIAHIAKETGGWTDDKILNTAFVKLNMYLVDAPKLIKNKKTEFKSDEELKAFFGI